MIAKNRKAIRIAFFVGLVLAILAQFSLWLFIRKTRARIALIRARTLSLILLGELAIHWHLDTAWVRMQWWFDNFLGALELSHLQQQINWKTFLAYWDGFGTGAGFGFLLGIIFLVALRNSPKQ